MIPQSCLVDSVSSWFLDSVHLSYLLGNSAGSCLSSNPGAWHRHSVLASCSAKAASVSSGPAGKVAHRLRTAEAVLPPFLPGKGGSYSAISFPSDHAPCFAFLWICPKQMLE